MKKIAFISCYFGKYPWFFDFFLNSCKVNHTIDFLLFTDNILEINLPENVKTIYFDLPLFNKIATEKMGFTINVERSYKLCDFKPAFGLIFEDYLKEYDFWGMTDIDVIYGRIREFFTDELLLSYDIINVRQDYIVAWCMLFKNNEYINTLFKKSKDYEKVFVSKRNYGFDETNLKQNEIKEMHNIFKLECEIETFQHIILKEFDKGVLHFYFDLISCDGNPGELKWENGVFSWGNKFEILLYHLLHYKLNVFAINNIKWEKIPNTFYIDKYNFRKNNSIVSRVQVFFNDKLKYNLWKIFKKFDITFSMYIFKKSFKGIQEGNYINYLKHEKMQIINKTNGTSFLKINDTLELALYEMTFCSNYFFAGDIICRYIKTNDMMIKSFTIVTQNGFGYTYIKCD